MTPEQTKRAEKDAADAAKFIGLLLLTAMASKSSRELNQLEWKPETGKFYINGRSVSIASIRKYLLSIENKLGRKIAKLIDQLEKKEITLAAFQREFESTITSSHILAGALAVGGIASAVANPSVRARIASEIDFADKFIAEIRKGKGGSLALLKSRARSYFRAAAITYSQVEQEVRLAVGIQTEARRLLGVADHCRNVVKNRIVSPKRACPYWHGKWFPIADIPPIGTLICQRHCKCRIEYR